MNQSGAPPYPPYPGGSTTAPPPTTEPPNTTTPGPAGSFGPAGDPATLGQPMYPWLMGYQGPFGAPISGTQQSAESQLQNFIGTGGGGGGAAGAAPTNFGQQAFHYDPFDFSRIQSGMEGIQGLQDQRALQQLRSSAAAGGNALSGGLMQQEGDYLRGSNAAFNSTLGQMELGDVSNQRALLNALNQSRLGAQASEYGANQAAGASRYGAGLQNQLGNRGLNLQGIQDLFGMGQSEQQAAQTELSGQYQDYLRQSGALRDQFQYPDYLSLQTLARGYPTQTPIQYGQSNSQQLIDLLSSLGGSGGTDWASLLGSLGGGTTTQGQTDGVQYDGTHYDSTPAQSQQAQYQQWLAAMGQGTTGTGGGATNYQDRLTNEILASQRAQQGVKPSGAQKGMDVLAMLAALLGVGKSGGGHGASGAGGRSGGALGNIIDAIKNIGNQNPYPANSPQAAEWNRQFTGGGSPRTPGDYATATPSYPGAIGSTPQDPLSGGGAGFPLPDGGTGGYGSYLDTLPSVPQDFTYQNADNPPNIDIGGDLGGLGGGDFGGGGGDEGVQFDGYRRY